MSRHLPKNLQSILTRSIPSQTPIVQESFILTQCPPSKTKCFNGVTSISTLVGFPSYKPSSNMVCGFGKAVLPRRFFSSSSQHEEEQEDESHSGFDKVVRVAKTLKDSPSIEVSLSQLNALGFVPSHREVLKVMSIVDGEWKACLSVFHWAVSHAERKSEKVELYHTIIAILVRHKRFALAWGLIDKMKEQGKVSKETLRIMLEGYIEADDVGRATRTFSHMEYYRLSSSYEDLLWILQMLCRHMYIEDAELLMYKNKKIFPLDIKSFNILLDAWCNIVDDKREVKRVWEKLSDHCITPDAVSYMTVIPYYMKVDKFYDVVRLYSRMRKQGLIPNLDVVNSVISVLAKENCVIEAMNVFKSLEELGLNPDAVTYTCIINLCCQTWKKNESSDMLEKMIGAGFSPPLEIHNSFFRFIEDGDSIFKHLVRMIKTGSSPTAEMLLLSIRKCSTIHDYKTYFLLMKNMESFDFYTNMNAVHLILNAFLILAKPEDAHGCYTNMQAKGFQLEPELSKYFDIELAE